MTFKQRVEPFLALIEARYAPLLFVALPQSYSVFLWLISSSAARGNESFTFAVLGAAGFELVYVGTIAWAEGRTNNSWVWGTALTALVFSVMVSIRVYENEGWWSLLHAGFPIVAFAYTMTIHAAAKKSAEQGQGEYDAVFRKANARSLELSEELAKANAQIKFLEENHAKMVDNQGWLHDKREDAENRLQEALKTNQAYEEELTNLRARVEELQEYRTANEASLNPEFYDALPEPDPVFSADGGGDIEQLRQEFKQNRSLTTLYFAARAGVSKNTLKQWYQRYARGSVEVGHGQQLNSFGAVANRISEMMKDTGINWE